MDLNQNRGINEVHLDASESPVSEHVSGNEGVSPTPAKRGKKGKYQGQTGPRSTRGKEITRQNGKMIHGLRAKKLLLPHEDPEEFEAHMQKVIRALKPQDVVENDIVHAYGYAIWTSPRSEIYRQCMAHQHLKNVDASKLAQSLGFSTAQSRHAPEYLKDLSHVISPERIAQVKLLIDQQENLIKGLPREDYESIDWSKAANLYPELFDEFSEWVKKEGYSPPFFEGESRQIHLEWINDHQTIVECLTKLYCSLSYEASFMEFKPEIRAHLEQLFWQSHPHVMQGIGCGDHFIKVQNFGFTQLGRLAAYRKMKRKLMGKDEAQEG
jgi:hypothetical protein